MNKTTKTVQKITKDMLIGEIVARWPQAATVLMEDYGFHCVGCFASAMETLEQGAEVHGMAKEDMEVMIENLNELIEEDSKDQDNG